MLKKLLATALPAIFLVIALSACKEDSNLITIEDDGSIKLNGKIDNFNGSFQKIYSLNCSRIEADIKADGSFAIDIPLPSKDCLSSYSPYNDVIIINSDSIIIIDSIQISDENMKYIRADLAVESTSRITYSLPINLAKISNPNSFAVEGDYFISYYYFDTPCLIQGFTKMRTTGSNFSREIITEYNINAKEGWNKVITKFKQQAPSKSVYEVSQMEIDQGSWIIGASNSFSNNIRRF